MSKPYLKYMTEEDYLFHLPPYGKEIAEYWTEQCPKMCAEYEREHGKGSLYKRIQDLSEVLMSQACDLVQTGMSRPEIDEVIREQFQYEPEKAMNLT